MEDVNAKTMQTISIQPPVTSSIKENNRWRRHVSMCLYKSVSADVSDKQDQLSSLPSGSSVNWHPTAFSFLFNLFDDTCFHCSFEDFSRQRALPSDAERDEIQWTFQLETGLAIVRAVIRKFQLATRRFNIKLKCTERERCLISGLRDGRHALRAFCVCMCVYVCACARSPAFKPGQF